MAVSEIGSKAVPDPIGYAHEVAGVVAGAFEDRTDVRDTGDDDVDAGR